MTNTSAPDGEPDMVVLPFLVHTDTTDTISTKLIVDKGFYHSTILNFATSLKHDSYNVRNVISINGMPLNSLSFLHFSPILKVLGILF